MSESNGKIELNPLMKLRRDLRRGVATLTTGEVRFLVDTYYSIQDYRMQAANQVRSSTGEAGEPHEHVEWLFDQMEARTTTRPSPWAARSRRRHELGGGGFDRRGIHRILHLLRSHGVLAVLLIAGTIP